MRLIPLLLLGIAAERARGDRLGNRAARVRRLAAAGLTGRRSWTPVSAALLRGGNDDSSDESESAGNTGEEVASEGSEAVSSSEAGISGFEAGTSEASVTGFEGGSESAASAGDNDTINAFTGYDSSAQTADSFENVDAGVDGLNAGDAGTTAAAAFDTATTPAVNPFLEKRAPLVDARGLFGVGAGTAAVETPPAPSASSVGDSLGEGEMNSPTLVMNLLADLCPHGMLMLAFGMAAHGGTGTVPAVALLLGFCGVGVYTLFSLGRAAQDCNKGTLLGVWSDLVGPRSGLAMEAMVATLCFGCCIFYAAFIGDLFHALARSVNLPVSRAQVVLGLTAAPLLPLSLLRNLSVLGYSSMAGLAGIAFTTFFVIKRALDGSYAPGSAFVKSLADKYKPQFGAAALAEKLGSVGPMRVSGGSITLMNMACVAFMAHYNGVKYYDELENRSPELFLKTLTGGLGGAALVFVLIMLFGHRTFGAASQTLLLNNYATGDKLASVARLGTGVAIIAGFPLMFYALKTSVFAFLQAVDKKVPEDKMDHVSIIMLVTVAAIACGQTEESLAVVIGLIGSFLGSFVAYIVPATLNIKRSERRKLAGLPTNKFEDAAQWALLGFGAIFMAVGTAVTLKDAAAHH